VTGVRVRYRFITEEVPGGYYGSEFNDYFQVALRSGLARRNAVETNSMNGLGLAAFDPASGATGWRDATLPVDVDGDTIQADIVVANIRLLGNGSERRQPGRPDGVFPCSTRRNSRGRTRPDPHPRHGSGR